MNSPEVFTERERRQINNGRIARAGIQAAAVVLPDQALPIQYQADVDPSNPLAWQDGALCAETDPDEFFPEQGQIAKLAREICVRHCEVREQCLEYALKNGEQYGVWGGLSIEAIRKYAKKGLTAAEILQIEDAKPKKGRSRTASEVAA